MKYEDVLELGWVDRYPTAKSPKGGTNSFEFGDYIMSVTFGYEDGFDLVLVKNTDGEINNVWENSETTFYGMIKTKLDLDKVMQFVGVIEYKD